jgi:hypothetical protein
LALIADADLFLRENSKCLSRLIAEAKIAFVLKQAEDGSAMAEVCCKTEISEPTFLTGGRNMRACCRRR